MFLSTKALRAVLSGLSVGVLALAALWLGTSPRLRNGGFMPHGVCYTWNDGLIALHLVSDALIGMAYFSIPVAILYFTRKRRDLPFSWIFLLFGIFIVACGATHWMEVWTLWFPNYWLSGAIKAITAGASVPTAVALIFLIPKALSLPSRSELEEAKRRLEEEVAERLRAEQRLRAAHAMLEERVAERTRELQSTNEELQSQRASLREADRAKDRFLAVLAHELRNPLQPIKLSTHVIKQLVPQHPTLDAAAGVIERQLNQMIRLLDDLLDVARITQDRMKVNRERFRVWKAVQAAVETCAPMVEDKAQSLAVENSAGDAWVEADLVRLSQVIGNVLSNASKFSGRGGRIVVRLGAVDGEAVIAVSDEGSGISPEDLPHVFELFRRGAERPEEGLGVGLGLAKRLIEMQGGSIRASSEGSGKGTVVEMRMPLSGSGAGDVEPPVAEVRSSAAPLKVLVADDNRDGAQTMGSILEMYGHDVRVVHDGQAALDMLLSRPFDVALLDIGMPLHDGYSVAACVRERLPRERVLLVAVTGYGTAADRQRAQAAGFDAHMTKPVDVAELRALLVRVRAARQH